MKLKDVPKVTPLVAAIQAELLGEDPCCVLRILACIWRAGFPRLQHGRIGDITALRVGLLTYEHYIRAQFVQQHQNPKFVTGGDGK